MNRYSEDAIGGGPQAPVVRLLSTLEVTPTGVVISEEGRPRHWGHPRPITERKIGNLVEGGHPHISETGGSVPPRPDKDVPENWTVSCVITGHLVAALRARRISGSHTTLST